MELYLFTMFEINLSKYLKYFILPYFMLFGRLIYREKIEI